MKTKKLNIIIPIYIVLQSICFIFAQHPSSPIDIIFCYCSVILAFLITFIFINKKITFIFSILALFFTVIADYFLIIVDDYYTFAMVIFFLAQLSYAIRIYFEFDNKKIKLIYIIVRLTSLILAILLPLIILKDLVDFLIIISAMYYITLILSAIFSFILIKKNKIYLILSIGLLLFVCCDLFVALYNIESYISISRESFLYKVIYFDLNLSWIFYIPSQTLLGISLLKTYNK